VAAGLYKSLPQQNVMLSLSVSIQFCTDSNSAFFPQYKEQYVSAKKKEEALPLKSVKFCSFFGHTPFHSRQKRPFAVLLESTGYTYIQHASVSHAKHTRAPSGKEYLKHLTAKIFSIALMKSGKMHTRGGAEGAGASRMQNCPAGYSTAGFDVSWEIALLCNMNKTVDSRGSEERRTRNGKGW
jgi:hypothetical protein